MNKFKSLYYYFPLLGFCALIIRMVSFGAEWPEAVAIFAVSGLYGFMSYLKAKEQEPLNDKVSKEVQQLKDTVDALRIGKLYNDPKGFVGRAAGRTTETRSG